MRVVRELNELFAGEGSAYGAAGHVLVIDAATGVIYTEDNARRLAERWQEELERVGKLNGEVDDLAYEHAQCYIRACRVSALHAKDVTIAVQDALREESGTPESEPLTWGW